MYERFFGLGDAPFRLTPDPRYLFLSRKHADALAHLRLGLSESSGFVCITGDVGTGKTTVLRHFLGELTPEASVAYVVNPTLSPLELLQTINLEFGLSGGDSKKQLIDRLNRHLLEQRHANRCSVVVVDEAQALSMEVL
jgi:general secretion pathway protein A